MKKLLISIISLISLSSFAADQYQCQVIGEFTNLDNETARVEIDKLTVEVNASRSTLFGREQEPEHEWDTRPEVMPWSISIRSSRDGKEKPLILTLSAPNQNAAIAMAYAEPGSKYIGFVVNSELEAICIKK